MEPHGGTGVTIRQPGLTGDHAQEVPLPSLAAGLVASLAGWMIDDVIQPYLGAGLTFVLSLACSTAIFFVARRWLIELRGR
jgi:hypothetical protein